MAIVASRARQRSPEPEVVKEVYAVRATHVGDSRLCTYMVGEPDLTKAQAKANDIWNAKNITSVELTAEVTVIIARKVRPAS